MSASPNPQPPMFAEPTPPRSFPTTAVAIAGTAIAILVGFFILLAHRHTPPPPPRTPQPLATYASNLKLTAIEVLQADTNMGGKSTYIDGHITNNGPATVTGITAQCLFPNDEAMPPQVETTALYLIRTRDPYVDTEMVSSEPIPPGGQADFRLIFENIRPNWNSQPPEIRLTQISTK